MQVWITKYALTTGVLVREATLVEGMGIRSNHMISVREGSYTTAHYHKPHWYTTREEADNRVRKMIETALAALVRKRGKLMQLLAKLDEKPS